MDEAYEFALAQEGERGSALSEDQWMMWEEKLALAHGVAAKKALVLSAFGATTPDVRYRTALLTLLEVQELLDVNRHEEDTKADVLMEQQRGKLLASERELQEKSFWRKAKRISQRRAVLELEVAMRLRKPEAMIQELSRAVATEIALTLSDSPPANADAATATDTPLKTALNDEIISTETKVLDVLTAVQYIDDEGYYTRRIRQSLEDMNVYARELLFAYVANDKSGERGAVAVAKSLLSGVLGKSTTVSSSPSLELSAKKRWWILELFLDDFAFEYAHVDGYVDVIIEDFKKTRDADKRTFGSRKAHERLSLVQLNELLEKEPGLFRNDPLFALRYIHLVQSVAKIEQASELDAHGDVQRAAKIAEAENAMAVLAGFSVRANPLRALILHGQLQELQYHDANGLLKPKFFQYLQLPRFGADFVNLSYIRSARAEELVVFSEPSYHYRSASVQPTTSLRVDQASTALGKEIAAADDLSLVKAILYALWSSGQLTDDDEKLLRRYLANEFVDAEKAECMVVSGRGELSVWKDKLPRKGEELTEWSATTEISFCESNATHFGLEDEVELFVNVRNVHTLTVQVYEVRTIDYYTRLRREVQGNISLDGLLPNEEQRIDLSRLSPWHKSRVHVKLSPNAKGRCGVFVVEVFEKDTTCRAILRKGYLRHVERITSRGHEFTVLDERGVVLKDASLLLMNLKDGSSKAHPPRTFHPIDASGVIVIPFRQSGESASDSFGIVFQHDDYGCLLRPFDYVEATFSLTTEMYIDAEQLRPGDEATVLARALLSVGSRTKHSVSVDMLTDVKATISFASVNKSSSAGVSHKVVQSFDSVKELMEGRCTIQIPLDAEELTVEIAARVKTSPGTTVLRSLPLVKSSKMFGVQRVTQFDATFTPHFLRRPMALSSLSAPPRFEYYIAVMGHNGEPISAKRMHISIKHMHFETAIQQTLQTDGRGEIRLGELAFVDNVNACFADNYVGANSWTWELPNQRTYAPQMVNCAPHETIRIPLPRAIASYVEEWLQAGLITLCRVLEPPEEATTPVLEVMEDNPSCIKNSSGEAIGVTFTIARAGIFLLYVRPLDVKFPVTVVSKKQIDSPAALYSSILVQQKKVLLATPTSPLTILSHRAELASASGKTWLHVELDQAKPETTRVWLVLKRYLSQSNANLTATVVASSLSNGGGHYLVSSLAFESTIIESEYLKKRKISDEYTYILQRRAFLRNHPASMALVGTSSFPTPTLIQTPHVVDESDVEELTMRDGDKVSGFKTREAAESAGFRMASGSRCFARDGYGGLAGVSSISFLAEGSAVAVCSPVSAQGMASVCLSDIALFSDTAAAHLELVIVAFDSERGHATSVESQISTPTCAIEQTATTRDVRLSPEEALHDSIPSMQIQRHEVLNAGANRTLPRTFSSKYALYETLGSAMDLWATLCSDTEIPDLVEQLKKWPSMPVKDKLVFYGKNACDDLNFFLFQKDRKFFDVHVKPFVSAKLSKSLVDLVVLDDTLSLQERYGHPGVFQKLSVIEKLLFAQRAATAEQKDAMCRHVIDAIDGAIAANSSMGHQLSSIFDTVLSQGAVKPEPVDEEIYEEESESFKAESSAPPPPPDGFSFGGQMDRFMDTRGSVAASQSFGAAAPAPLMRSRVSAMAMPTSMASLSMKKKSKVAAAPFSLSNDDEDEDSSQANSSDGDDDDGDDNDNFGVESLNSDTEEKDDPASDDHVQDDAGNSEHDRIARKRELAKRRALPYLLPGKVRRVQEKRFFHSQKPPLDGRNLFWRDYAQHLMDRDAAATTQAFLSSHFPEALRSFTEGILAISVLDLATSDEAPTTSVRLLASGVRVQLDAVADVVLYHQGIGPGPIVHEPNSTLVLKQRLVSQADRMAAQSSDFADLRPAREFIVNRIYSCVVSVSNISSKRLRDVNLLMQIPRGAIPLTTSGFYTQNEVIEVAPHDTKTLSFDFYFPAVGHFTQYPAHASLEGKVVAWASTDDAHTKPITVVAKATAVDLTSWSDVAARGSLDDVLAFLQKETAIVKLGLDALAWRCLDSGFYSGVTTYLRQRWVFVESIWKYAFQHNDVLGIKELIAAKSDFLRALGHGVHTSIVQFSSSIYHQERFDASFSFDHTEFGPLLSRRAHRVAGKSASSSGEVTAASSDNEPARVLHKKAREYYRTLCQTLSLQASLSAEQLLVMAYFLILFHRMEDALSVFERAKALEATVMRDAAELSIAADYMDAYLDFFRVSADMAAPYAIARRHTAKYAKLSNDRWRERFLGLQDILNERDELRAAALTAAHQAASLSHAATASQPMRSGAQRVPDDDEVRLTADVKGDEVFLTSQNLGACEISFYRIDVELMFSTEPFDSFSDSAASKSSLLLIKPYQQLPIQLATDTARVAPSTTVWKIPKELAASPLLLRIREVEASRTVSTIAAPIDLTRSYFNSKLQVIVTKQAGFVQVLHEGTPVWSCYVKVYAKASALGRGATRGKQTQFYKDGYTDVLGKFDYAAVNGDLLTRVEKFSILVSHPTLGTTVHQVAPPVVAVTASEFQNRDAREALWF